MISKVIKKIIEHGFWGFARKVLCFYIDKFLCFLMRQLLPLNRRLIIFESSGDFCDNSFALFSYMQEKEIAKKYKIAWLVSDMKNARKKKYDVTLIPNDMTKHSWNRCIALSTAFLYIYDHNNFLEATKREGQRVVNLWHGIPIKAGKGAVCFNTESSIDLAISTSAKSSDLLSVFCNYPVDKFIVTGYPRNDYLLSDTSKQRTVLSKYVKISDYRKVIIWMPTYRKSDQSDLSENYLNNETGLPLFSTIDQLVEFDKYLEENNILVLLKIHYLQTNLPVFEMPFNNIRIIRDSFLSDIDLQLYQIVALSDALITDYSSITYDYLLLNKPIIFIVDDLDEFKRSRGFIEDAVDSYFVGVQVSDKSGLQSEISKILDGVDVFEDKRISSCKIIHRFQDANSSKRLVQLLNL